MELHRKGWTLIEIIIVLIIIGIMAAVTVPNLITSVYQARGSAALNNLLAIYGAQQNFNNNNGYYCMDWARTPSQPACQAINANCGHNLASLNCNLNLNIPDDGTYAYSCGDYGAVASCQALYAAYTTNPITVFLTGVNGAIQYPLSKNINPYSGDCPGAKCPF